MTQRLPQYRLADYSADLGVSEAEWIADLAARGWRPFPSPESTPAECVVNGRTVTRWSLVRGPQG